MGVAVDPLIGQVVQHFRIVQEIGRGGMGVVYAAEHSQFPEKRAAVKVLPPYTSPEARAQLFHEARACMRLSHEGLVDTYDCGELQLPTGTTPYILMQLIPGETLRARLLASAEGRLDVGTALELALQVAAAMAYSHGQGVIHRDLKPGNLMLSPDSRAPTSTRVKVLDFGIAKLVGEQPTQQMDRVRGTLSYIPPERLSGAGDLDGRGDVYALGCVLYEMLCGNPPFSGEDAAVQVDHLKRTPIPLRRRAANIPTVVERLVQRTLAKDPGARPTMAELAERLRSVLAEPQALASRPRDVIGTFFASRRNILLPLLLLLGLGYFSWPHLTGWLHPNEARFPSATYKMGTAATALHAAYELSDRVYGTLYGPGDPREPQLYRKNKIFDRELPQREVRLQSFRLDRHEARNADYAAWLEESGRRSPRAVEVREKSDSRDGSIFYEVYFRGTLLNVIYEDTTFGGLTVEEGRVRLRKGMENRPVTTVTWEGARQYCLERGARLPTEAEWEYAATNRGRYRYPWGDQQPDCSRSVLERGTYYRQCIARTPSLPEVCSEHDDITDDGVCDLGGSVSEWVEDRFEPTYPSCGPLGCTSPVVRAPTEEEHRESLHVLRGGAWSLDFLSARATGRRSALREPTYTAGEIGFRCARDAK